MCNKCGGRLELISFRWDNEGNLTEVYRCKKCEKRIEMTSEAEDVELSELIINNDLYSKYNL